MKLRAGVFLCLDSKEKNLSISLKENGARCYFNLSHDTSALTNSCVCKKALCLLQNIPVRHDACSEKLPNGLKNKMICPLHNYCCY